MQSVSKLWRTLRALPGTEVEWRFDIESVTYGKENEVSHSANHSLFTEFGFGNTGCGGLNLQLYADSIPKGAEIKRFCRLINGEQVSEWLAMGVYYTNLRSEEDGFWEIEAFDNMRKAEKVWEPDQSLEFPMPMDEAVAEICRVLGFTLDSRTTIFHDYNLDYPQSEQTFRQTLNWIAAAHGGNFIFTGEGKLRLVPLVSIPLEADGAEHQIGQDLFSAKNNGKRKPVSRVTLFADDEYVYTAGNDDGMELVADCAYATQAMVDNLLSVCKGFSYQAFEAEGANLDPAAELGDGVLADGMYSVFARIAEDGSGYPNISAPGDLEREEEYPEGGFWEQRFNRKLAQTRSLISKTTDELLLMVEDFDGRISQLSVDVDSIEGRVEGVEGEFTSFILETDGFYIFDESGKRTAFRGDAIDTTTLNVQDINFTGVIRWTDFNEDTQGYIDEIYDLAAEAWDMADSVQLPAYIKSTYIDFTKVQSPRIEANDIGLYGGYFEIYDGSGRTKYGSLGFGSGLTTAGDTTYGMVMSAEGNTDLGEEGNYFIATNAGVRMQSGGSKVFAVDGMAVLESGGNQIYVGAAGAYIKVGGVISAINGSGGGDGGGGGGNMSTAVYDPTGEVAAAGGIAAFVRAVHGSGGSGGGGGNVSGDGSDGSPYVITVPVNVSASVSVAVSDG